VNILVTGWGEHPKVKQRDFGPKGWQLPHESLATALVEELASNVQEALTKYLSWWWFQIFFIFTPIWGRFPF